MHEKNLNLQNSVMRKVKRIHFVGIGGAGMGGIAEVLFHLGYLVSGSDIHHNDMTKRLSRLGIYIEHTHDAKHVENKDVIVASSAIAEDNAELQRAKALRIPVIARAEMLAELMRFRFGVAVAGSHGKTSTTSMIASILTGAHYDPTYIIGGQLNQIASNAYLGTSRYLIAEADESDASFLYLHPMLAVVTNLDADHLGTYDGDFNKMQDAFIQFLHQLPFYGRAIVALDDPVMEQLIPKINRPLMTFGFHEEADLRAVNLRQKGAQVFFDVLFQGESYPAKVSPPGKHNVQNALASLCVAHLVDIPMTSAVQLLGEFSGIARRFHVYGDLHFPTGKHLLIDDYGHHPKEIEVTLETVRAGWPERRVVMVYQPHRYTRTRDLFTDFVEILSKVDVLILLDVYTAGETEIPGATGSELCTAIEKYGKIRPLFLAGRNPELNTLENLLKQVLEPCDLILLQGAGNIGKLAENLAAQWCEQETYA